VSDSPEQGPEPDVRFSLANERTLLAYQRTTIGLIAAAVAVTHFLDNDVLAYLLAGLLVLCAAVAGVGGYLRYLEADRAIREGRGLGLGRTPVVLSAGLVVCVLVAAVYVFSAG
jgi:putative membrane protein